MKRFSWTGLAVNGMAVALLATQLRQRRKLQCLAKRVRRDAALLHTAIRITHEIRGKTDIPLMLTVATEQISVTMRITHCFVILHECEYDKRIALCSCRSQDHENEVGLKSVFEAVSHEITQRQLAYFLSHNNSLDSSRELLIPVIGIPIPHESGSQLGTLFVASSNPRRIWLKNEVEMLLSVAHQLSLSVQHARIFHATERQARTDFLTGCLNRRGFDNTLDVEFSAALENQTLLSCITIDIDSFKRINDNYSHDTGDIAIRTVANIVIELTKGSGVVGRFGGDEFGILLPGYSAEKSATLAEQIRDCVARTRIPDFPESVTVSMGIATFPTHALLQKDLLLMADRALYDARDSGRNCARIARSAQLLDDNI
jgi:diguanylate cyclase (GGDEF)-like protein